MKKVLLFLYLLIFSAANCQQPAFRFGNLSTPVSIFRIVIPSTGNEKHLKAAREIQKYIEASTGYRIEMVADTIRKIPAEIIIGECKGRTMPLNFRELEPDEFAISVSRDRILIAGGSDKGLLYGVYDLLERYFGCGFFAPGVQEVIKKQEISIPELNYISKPAFLSREVYYAGMADQDFADKMRCDRNAWKGSEDWGMWVHTMFSLVPPEKYFDTHPEYYALMAGKRGKTQLCLTNPDVLRITIEELGRKMKEKPGAKYWSVSQMDTYGWCECDECKKIDEREGSPSGTMIGFVNKVAAAFPDKIISTLAYQYTRSAPKHIRPASNVNIMLCTIECDRGKPIDSDTSKGSFYADLRDWSKIANDILVWDYVIQFTNMIAPFPNFHVLQPNIKLFSKFGVKGVFEQGCHGTYSENQELRQFILARLLWNPDLNLDSLMNVFYRGYYGNAASWIRKYNSEMVRAQIASGKPLWIYGAPVQETGSFLTPELIRKYDEFFDEAEFSVTLDPERLPRVKMARLPLRFAKLEIARKNITGTDGFLENRNGIWTVKQTFADDLGKFVEHANLYGVRSIQERGYSPDQYKENVLVTMHNAFTKHLALNMPYTLVNPPGQKYMADGPGSLTDGKRGFENYYILWQGFEGVDFEMTVDLGESREINYVGAEFLQDNMSWIFMPEFITFSGSEDRKSFQELARIENTVSPKEKLPVIKLFDQTIPVVKTRYIKVFAKSVITCPDWHIGHGGKAWVFADEIVIDKK